jgi:hypothetical protein
MYSVISTHPHFITVISGLRFTKQSHATYTTETAAKPNQTKTMLSSRITVAPL